MKFKEHKEITKKYGFSGDWLNLEKGDNKIRIVSELEDYGDHYDPLNKKRVPCVGEENCFFCKKRKELISSGADVKSKEVKGLNSRVQFLFWVIDRKDKAIKLIRVGYQIYKQIGKLADSEEYGFDSLPDYDITIVKTGEGLETEYNVIPARAITPLTEKEEKEIEEKVKSPLEVIDRMKAKVISIE